MRILAVLVLSLLAGCTSLQPPSTLAIVNAKIWTGDAAKPWAEGIAARDGRIVAIGSNAEIRAIAANPIDAHGRLIVPGFIDSHIHFISGGFQLSSVQLRDARTRDEFVRRIRDFAGTVPKGTWITGGDWDHSLWGGELPERSWIDAVTPDHPVWVSRLDGHMAIANSAALKIAGVTRDTQEVEGGTIVRRADGEPAGVFKDNAMELVDKVVPSPTPLMQDRALEAAMKYVAAQGVTSIHHMGGWTDLETFTRAHRAKTLTTRVYAAVPLSSWERLRDLVAREGKGDSWLRIGALKGFVDGSLGSHTAAFHEPFSDAPQDRGLLVNTPEDLQAWVSGAEKSGLQVVVHAIGDRANGMLLDIYERVFAANGPRDRRFRIEHAQHLTRADIPRFATLGVVASMQPYHAIDDGRWAETYIGDRIKTTYAFRSLLDVGAHLAFGSDWSVAPATPLEGIYAAVTRRTLDDRNPSGWVPEQKISVEEALRAYTSGAAYAAFDEGNRGVLSSGRLADFVMLDHDIFEIPPAEIRDVKVIMTVVDGKVVFRHE